MKGSKVILQLHPLCLVIKSLDIYKDPFQLHENDEEFLGEETTYLNVIGVLMYLANYTRSDILFCSMFIGKT